MYYCIFLDWIFDSGPEGPELEGQQANREFKANKIKKERLTRHRHIGHTGHKICGSGAIFSNSN